MLLQVIAVRINKKAPTILQFIAKLVISYVFQLAAEYVPFIKKIRFELHLLVEQQIFSCLVNLLQTLTKPAATFRF